MGWDRGPVEPPRETPRRGPEAMPWDAPRQGQAQGPEAMPWEAPHQEQAPLPREPMPREPMARQAQPREPMPTEAPGQQEDLPPWESREQAPDRQPGWRTALGRGREPSRPPEQPQEWSPFSKSSEPASSQGPGGDATGGPGAPEPSEGETRVSREAIRAAIRGEAVPGGALPGFDARGSRADRTGRGGGDDRGDRLVLPEATGEGPPSRRANAFPSEAELLKQPPRWQRMLRRLPVETPGEGQPRRAPSVRDRERQRALRRFGVLVAIIVVVGAGLWLASVRGRSPSEAGRPSATAPPPALVSVQAASVAASTQSGSRLAGNVIDGKLGTFWSRLVPSNDAQPFLRFSFDHPVELGRVAIAGGASGSEFSKRPRPQEVELQFSDGTTLRTTLADKQGFQTVNFRPREVDRLRLVVLSTYPSSGPQRTSISEVRFFAVRS